MTVILIIITVCIVGIEQILMKTVSRNKLILPQTMLIFSSGTIISVVLGIAGGMELHSSTVMIAAGYCLANILGSVTNIKAMRDGMASHVVFITSCSFLVPTVFSIFAY